MRTRDAAVLLGIGRATVFGIWFVHVLITPVSLVTELPSEMFRAKGALSMLPDELYRILLGSRALLVTWKSVMLAGCLALALGVRPFRPIALPVSLLLLVFDGVIKSYAGWVSHQQMGILFAAHLLCLFPAADAFSVMGRKQQGTASTAVYAGGLLTVAVFLCATYTFIGTHRVVSGGYAIFTGDAILTYLAVQSLNYGAFDFQYGLLGLSMPWLGVLFKFGFGVTTVVEILSPLALVSARFRRLWLVVIVPFHVFTLFTMNIFFWENLFLIAVFVVPAGSLMTATNTGGMLDGTQRLRGFGNPAPERAR